MNIHSNPVGRGVDVIGDVHGHASRLEALLRSLGYVESRGVWRHPERIAVFMGDLIDRGPEQLRTLGIVRRMVDAGAAILLMGNHEFNAIGFGTPNGRGDGHLRPRTASNAAQHAAFLAEVGVDTILHREILRWFASLPTHLSFGGFRFAHACWDQRHVNVLGNEAIGFIDDSRLDAYFDEAADERKAAEIVLKGPEFRLPDGRSYLDGDGIERDTIRLAWWRRGQRSIDQMAVFGDIDLGHLGAVPVPEDWCERPAGPLTFIGHYWMKGDPEPIADDVVCVDFSVARDGVLAAYRLEPGDVVAHPGRFVWA